MLTLCCLLLLLLIQCVPGSPSSEAGAEAQKKSKWARKLFYEEAQTPKEVGDVEGEEEEEEEEESEVQKKSSFFPEEGDSAFSERRGRPRTLFYERSQAHLPMRRFWPPRSLFDWRRPPKKRPAAQRIFRGFDLDPHEFPWMVKVKVGRGKEKRTINSSTIYVQVI